MLSSALLSAPAAQPTATAAPSPPRSWLADDPPLTFAFDVVVLTSTRTALLRLVLASVARHVGPAARAVHVWIDRPAPKEVDAVERRRRKAGGRPLPPGVSAENATFAATHAALAPFRGSLPLRVLAFERHQGTRAVWLTALSREEPTLVLEDDVVVLPGVARWVALAHARMAAQPQILGASCQGQTTIAKIGFQRRQLPLKTSYLYALVGSHGFVLSPHHRHTLLEVLRSPHDLIVEGLLPTRWYKDFQARGLTAERMWTQELVAYAHRRKLYNLYPPNAAPFSLHCATDHGADKATKRCADAAAARGNYSGAMLPCPGCARFSVASPLPVIEWDGGCGKECAALPKGYPPTGGPPPKEPPRAALRRAGARGGAGAIGGRGAASSSSSSRFGFFANAFSGGSGGRAGGSGRGGGARGNGRGGAKGNGRGGGGAAAGAPAASGAEVAAEAMGRVAKMFGG